MSFQLNRSSKEPMSEINVTPFVDVMLVLLIIFMVTAPLLTAVNKGAVTIKIISKTNITSTKGVTLISLIGSLDERFN